MISSVIHVAPLLLWFLAMSTDVRSTQAKGSSDYASYASFPIEDSTPQIRRLWIVHGVLMMVGFSLFIPIAICGSLIRNFLPGAMWYRIHRLLNWAAVAVITISFCIAGYIKQVTGDFPHFAVQNVHRAAGLAIFLLVLAQVTLGACRPDLAKTGDSGEDEEESESTERIYLPDDESVASSKITASTRSIYSINIKTKGPTKAEKGKKRIAWEVFHRILGISVLVLGWWNCYTGLQEFEDRVGEPMFAQASALVLGTAGISGGVLVVFFLVKFLGPCFNIFVL